MAARSTRANNGEAQQGVRMNDAASRSKESERLDGRAASGQKLPTYQELLDESLDQTFPASDPIAAGAAAHAEAAIESGNGDRDWVLLPSAAPVKKPLARSSSSEAGAKL